MKNIVIFSDGTGQDGGTDHNTNVYKTFNMILNRSPRQVSYYDRGLGTGWRKATGNIAGRGFSTWRGIAKSRGSRSRRLRGWTPTAARSWPQSTTFPTPTATIPNC